MVVDDFPVRASVAVARAVDGFVARDSERRRHPAGIIIRVVADDDILHLVIRRPQVRLVYRFTRNRRRLRVVDGHGESSCRDVAR